MGRILITGGFGYVGGRITRHMAEVAGPATLRVLTRRGPDRVPGWVEGIEVVRGDLRDPATLAIAVAGAETVVHLAAPDEVRSLEDPDEALEVTGRGTHRLLEAARKAAVRRFVYFSTFHVYGPWARGLITEETATRPVHPYAITHRLAEDFVNWYRHAYGMQTLILRLSNAYGCPADPNINRWTLVFNDLCQQAVHNGQLVLRSSGLEERDFISLADVAHGVEHLLTISLGEWEDGLFNLGGECVLTIWEVAERIAAVHRARYGKEVPVLRGKASLTGKGPGFSYSIAKLKRTGFSPKGNMEEEIWKTFTLCEQRARGGQAGQ